MFRKNLDSSCPMGHSSTKHMSNKGKVHSLELYQLSNRARRYWLNQFFQFVKQSPKDFFPVKVCEYNKWSEISHSINSMAPEGIDDVIPLGKDKTIEYVFNTLLTINCSFSANLIHFHSKFYNECESHQIAARSVMEGISKDPASYGLTKTLKYKGYLDDKEGFPISSNDYDALMSYQKLQERFIEEKYLDKINQSIQNNLNVLETLLGIQRVLCNRLEEFFDLHEDARKASLSFSEIGMPINSETNSVIPSSRFLKVIVHNMAHLVFSSSNLNPGLALVNALNTAHKNQYFKQKLPLLRQGQDRVDFLGCIDVVCQARTTITNLISHYIK